MTFILVGASLILTLVALGQFNLDEFSELGDPTRHLVTCLAYGFAPAAIGYVVAIVNRVAGRGRTSREFYADRNWAWIIFLLIFASGQVVQNVKP